MFLDKNRHYVGHPLADPANAFCPDCGGKLIAKAGSIVKWHWSHKSSSDANGCGTGDLSDWHETCTQVYNNSLGWEVEYHKMINGSKYIFDAYNPQSGVIVEFVHSLSDRYFKKYNDLLEFGCPMLWILDGEEFISINARYGCGLNSDGFSKMLKPKAHKFIRLLGGDTVVHHRGVLYKHWKNNVFFPVEQENNFCSNFAIMQTVKGLV